MCVYIYWYRYRLLIKKGPGQAKNQRGCRLSRTPCVHWSERIQRKDRNHTDVSERAEAKIEKRKTRERPRDNEERALKQSEHSWQYWYASMLIYVVWHNDSILKMYCDVMA